MSLISEQIKRLRELAIKNSRNPNAMFFKHCADTIEELSEKLSAQNMKRSTMYCNGGWIPCSERLPEVRKDCLVTVRYSGFLGMHGFWVKTGHVETDGEWWGDCMGGEVTAWMPLPEPYKGV